RTTASRPWSSCGARRARWTRTGGSRSPTTSAAATPRARRSERFCPSRARSKRPSAQPLTSCAARVLRRETGMTPYLPRLTARPADGVARLPADRRQRHARYLLASQNPDGGFSGREGGSDLYYTGFALRGLAVLDALSPRVCDHAAGFLRSSLRQQAT